MAAYYDDPEAAKVCILSNITFCETCQKVSFLNYSMMVLGSYGAINGLENSTISTNDLCHIQ